MHRRENNDADSRGFFFEFKARGGSGARSVTDEERRSRSEVACAFANANAEPNRGKRPRSVANRERSEPFSSIPFKNHLYWYFRDVALGSVSERDDKGILSYLLFHSSVLIPLPILCCFEGFASHRPLRQRLPAVHLPDEVTDVAGLI